MRKSTFIISSIFVTSPWFFPAPVSGQGEEEAKKHFEQGAVLYREGDYQAALVEIKESYRLRPNWRVRFYISATLQALHRFVEAEGELNAYIEEGGENVTEEKRAEVEEILAGLKGVIGTLEIKSNIPGASVYIDGEPAGEAPHHVRLDVGYYRVELKRDGYEDFVVEIDVPGGKSTAVEARLKRREERVEKSPPAEEKEEKKEEKKSRLDIYGWAALGAGGALLAAGAATGGLALSLGNDLEERCPEGRCGPGEHDDLGRMERLALTTDILIGIGAAVAAAGISLLFIDRRLERKGKAVSYIAPTGIVFSWR